MTAALVWRPHSPTKSRQTPITRSHRGRRIGTLGFQTAGEYRLLVGLDAPEVLEGDASPTGDVIAALDLEVTPLGAKVQKTTGVISDAQPEVVYELADARVGDTLYVYVEATSGDSLRLVLVLSNYANKPVAQAAANDAEPSGTLTYTFDESASNFSLALNRPPPDRRQLANTTCNRHERPCPVTASLLKKKPVKSAVVKLQATR